MEKYKGSGKYWKNHISTYGREHVVNLEVFSFEDQLEASTFARMFSEYNCIVNSKLWANLTVEDALSGEGWPKGKKRGPQSKEHRNKNVISHTGLRETEITKNKKRKSSTGRKHSTDTLTKLSKINTGLKQSQETILKRICKTKGKTRSEETKIKMSLAAKMRPPVLCEKCNILFPSYSINRHFTVCGIQKSYRKKDRQIQVCSGEQTTIYKNIKEIINELQLSEATIYRIMRGQKIVEDLLIKRIS